MNRSERAQVRGSALSLWLIMLLGLAVIASGCSSGAGSSWDEEAVVESNRLLSDQVAAEWSVENSEVGETIRIRIRKTDGDAIDDYAVTHEKLMHLIVVSEDLSYFNHIHPAYLGDGVFEVTNDFPAGGKYRFIADFKPANGDAMTKLTWMEVPGNPLPSVPVVPDDTLEKVVDGNRVKLEIADGESERELSLAFTLTDEETGAPVDDLEPYLGAIGHVVILTADGEKYVHVHAEEGQGSGPEAAFEATLPGSGVYKIWGQFQRGGQVFTASYVVTVPA